MTTNDRKWSILCKFCLITIVYSFKYVREDNLTLISSNWKPDWGLSIRESDDKQAKLRSFALCNVIRTSAHKVTLATNKTKLHVFAEFSIVCYRRRSLRKQLEWARSLTLPLWPMSSLIVLIQSKGENLSSSFSPDLTNHFHKWFKDVIKCSNILSAEGGKPWYTELEKTAHFVPPWLSMVKRNQAFTDNDKIFGNIVTINRLV